MICKRAVCLRECKGIGCGVLLEYDVCCLPGKSRLLTPRINE